VGHTTDTAARLWMRAVDPGEFRTVGVAALFDGERCIPGSALYFRLQREYDRTGIVDFNGLSPATRYAVRMGSLITDSTNPDILMDDDEIYARLPPPDAWLTDLAKLPASESEALFTTFPGATTGFSFLFGSCRYPGILSGKKRADEIFRAMGTQMSEPSYVLRPRFNMMIGDQIYADELHRAIPIARAETPAQFHDRYFEAFTSPYFRALTRALPTYMILDDHEIEDNWVQGRLRTPAKRAVFNHAIHAYLSYQWVHGPHSFGKRLYYTFDYADVPFFVLDERTERIRDDDDPFLEHNHLLGYPPKHGDSGPPSGQIDRFCDWLVQMQRARGDVPKFVVSASVFAPNTVADVKAPAKSDSWPAFPATRRTVLKTMVDNGVQNVVFLCGDVHSANVAALEFHDANGTLLPLKAFVITSSAFYWPFPFADGDERSFVHDSQGENDGFMVDQNVTMHYRATAFEQDNNFARITVDLSSPSGKQITVAIFGYKGNALKSTVLSLA
jgi:alkaline phosphatase D